MLRVDGGMAASDVAMQFLADILAAPVDRPAVMENDRVGAAISRAMPRVRPDLAGFCKDVEMRALVRAAHGCCNARAQMARLARRC